MPSVIVIGAGWAGLMCAYHLAKENYQVTLIEAAPQAGGRARMVPWQGHELDNGQHICIGAYHNLRQALHELGTDINDAFSILPLRMVASGKQKLDLQLPNFLAPWNLLIGLATAKHLPYSDRFRALKFCYKLSKINFTVAPDLPLRQFLKNYDQSDNIINLIWEPIALAAMSTQIDVASTQVFLNILQQCFNNDAENSNWYLPKMDLSDIFPTPVTKFLQAHGHQIIYSQAITQLSIKDKNCIKVASKNQSWQADHVVLAIPPWQAKKLLEPHPDLEPTHNKLANFRFESIMTIYFEYPHAVGLPYPMINLPAASCQWIFDKSFSDNPQVLSAIICSPEPRLYAKPKQLVEQVITDISRAFPWLAHPVNYKIIHEKRAAFTCDVATQNARPTVKTEVTNLWLSGDYIQTGLPATLESALISGRKTAAEILRVES